MSTTHHRQFLYLSQLVDGVRCEQYAAICNASRRRNAQLQLSGFLLFDGYRFCALLEGPAEAVEATRKLIAADTRHEHMKVLIDRALEAPGTQRSWLSGYCDSEDLDPFESSALCCAHRTIAAFREVVRRSHLSP